MTHGECPTVSPFFGFHTRDVYESLLEWKRGDIILSNLFYDDDDVVNTYVNRKARIEKMIEEISEAEYKLEDIPGNTESDGIEIPPEVADSIQICNEGLSGTLSLPVTKNMCPESPKCDVVQCEKLNSPKEGSHVLLQSDQNPEVDVASNSRTPSTHGRRCSSPLLFTPVKGEDTYGAGLLSQTANFQVPVTTPGKVATTPKNLPPRFCTPSPISNTKSVTVVDGSGLPVTVGMKRSNRHCTNDSHIKRNNTSIETTDLKVKHSRSEYITKLDVSPNQVYQNLHRKKEELPWISPSPPKIENVRKETAAQIDSSPSASECSDASLFITPIKEEENSMVAQKLNLAYKSTQTRIKRKHRLRTLVTRVKLSLSGIPPPPAFTIPQIGVDEMILKLKKHNVFVSSGGCYDTSYCSSSSVLKNTESNVSPSASIKDGVQCNLESISITGPMVNDIENTREDNNCVCSHNSVITGGAQVNSSQTIELHKLHDGKESKSLSLFQPSASEKEIVDMPWPAVLDCVHLGICYNIGTNSETLEELCQQVRERYVGNETASSCTIWSACNSSKRSSTRLRKNSNSQTNSQAREGYVMRRRRAFSLATLSSSIPSMTTKSRQILVNKVTKLSAESKNPRKVVEDKGTLVVKQLPKISLVKKIFEDQEGNNKLKRSYSFNDSSSSSMQSSALAKNESSFSQSSSKLMSTKRVLKFDRLPRAASSPSLDTPFSQSKLGATSQGACDNISSLMNNTPDQMKNLPSQPVGVASKDLSEVYKKKLLWAVAEALRSRGLGSGHENFKLCAIPLFRRCRDAFVALPRVTAGDSVNVDSGEISHERACDTKSSSSNDSKKERTSDKMLSMALQMVDQVMNEVGVEPVIKEKCKST